MFILKYLLLPYLLFDIVLQLIFNIPMKKSSTLEEWKNRIGVHSAWHFEPTNIYLGEVTTVTDEL